MTLLWYSYTILMSQIKAGKKGIIHATVSPYIMKRVDELVADGKFSSRSDLVSIALAEFINKQKT